MLGVVAFVEDPDLSVSAARATSECWQWHHLQNGKLASFAIANIVTKGRLPLNTSWPLYFRFFSALYNAQSWSTMKTTMKSYTNTGFCKLVSGSRNLNSTLSSNVFNYEGVLSTCEPKCQELITQFLFLHEQTIIEILSGNLIVYKKNVQERKLLSSVFTVTCTDPSPMWLTINILKDVST